MAVAPSEPGLSGARRHLLHGDRLLHASLRLNIRNQVNTDSALGEKTSNCVSKRSSSSALPPLRLFTALPSRSCPSLSGRSLFRRTPSRSSLSCRARGRHALGLPASRNCFPGPAARPTPPAKFAFVAQLVVLPRHLTAAGPVMDTASDIHQHSG